MSFGFFEETETTKSISTVAKCGACGLYKKCRSPKMPVSGNGKRGVLVVAESPGHLEDKEGVQLVGESGQQLRKIFAKMGIDLDRDCWLTYAAICHTPGNAIPTDNIIDYCRPNLFNTIGKLQPKTIILLGGSAVKSIIGRIWKKQVGAIGRWVGWQIPCQELNAWICPTYHPSYLLRSNDKVLDLWTKRHLKVATQIENRPFPSGIIPDYEKSIRITHDPVKAAKILRLIASYTNPIAFDIECEGLKPDNADLAIISCSVCWNGQRTIAFPWVGEAIVAMKELLASPCPKIGWNIKFEHRWILARLGIRVRNWIWDGMQASHIEDNRPGITSLKFQAFVRLGMPSYDGSITSYFKGSSSNTPNQIRKISIDKLLRYNGLDSLLTYKIAEIQGAFR